MIAWVVKAMRAAMNETLDLQYTGFIVSHIAIFLVAYVFVDDVERGLAGDQRVAQLPVRAGGVDVEREALRRPASIRRRGSSRGSASPGA